MTGKVGTQQAHAALKGLAARRRTCLGLTFDLLQAVGHRHSFLRFRHPFCGHSPPLSVGHTVTISRARWSSGIGGGCRAIPRGGRPEGGRTARADLGAEVQRSGVKMRMSSIRSHERQGPVDSLPFQNSLSNPKDTSLIWGGAQSKSERRIETGNPFINPLFTPLQIPYFPKRRGTFWEPNQFTVCARCVAPAPRRCQLAARSCASYHRHSVPRPRLDIDDLLGHPAPAARSRFATWHIRQVPQTPRRTVNTRGTGGGCPALYSRF